MSEPSKEAMRAAEALRDEGMNYQWIGRLGIYEAAPVETIAAIIDRSFAEARESLQEYARCSIAAVYMTSCPSGKVYTPRSDCQCEYHQAYRKTLEIAGQAASNG